LQRGKAIASIYTSAASEKVRALPAREGGASPPSGRKDNAEKNQEIASATRGKAGGRGTDEQPGKTRHKRGKLEGGITVGKGGPHTKAPTESRLASPLTEREGA